MREDLDPREEWTPAKRESPADRPVTDREVPLGGRDTTSMLHAWLDGELAESAVRTGDGARDVEFWLRMNREMQVRRQMTTPTHVIERIMDALPDSVPTITLPWYRKSLEVSPFLAIAAIAAAVAVGMLIASGLHTR
jgi:hypothetical protein